jgi:hypothetical protein
MTHRLTHYMSQDMSQYQYDSEYESETADLDLAWGYKYWKVLPVVDKFPTSQLHLQKESSSQLIDKSSSLSLLSSLYLAAPKSS